MQDSQSLQSGGCPDAKYPYHQKRWRPTIWKSTGIRLQDGMLLLARAKGLAPIAVSLLPNLVLLPVSAFLDTARLGPCGPPS